MELRGFEPRSTEIQSHLAGFCNTGETPTVRLEGGASRVPFSLGVESYRLSPHKDKSYKGVMEPETGTELRSKLAT